MASKSTPDLAEVALRLGTARPADLRLATVIAKHVRAVMRASGRSVTLSAKALGIPRRTLQRMLARKLRGRKSKVAA